MDVMANTSTIIPSRHPFVKALVDGLAHRCEVKRGEHLLLAVSGGSDSTALLRAMTTVAQRRRWQLSLTIAHVQHHLRDEAEVEARFVEQLAKRLDLPFVRVDQNIPDNATNLEDTARKRRYDALMTTANQQNCTAIVTAHHAQDQLETLLMRLIRGSGLRGMGAMAWSRPLDAHLRLIRPLLSVDRPAIVDFLKQIKQRWHEDASNSDTTRLRALLRQSVIPQLLAIRADLPQQATTTTDQLRAVSDMLNEQCNVLLAQCKVSNTTTTQLRYHRKQLKAICEPMLGMVLRQMLINAGAPADRISARQLTQLGKLITDPHGHTRTVQFGRQVRINVTGQNVTVEHGQNN